MTVDGVCGRSSSSSPCCARTPFGGHINDMTASFGTSTTTGQGQQAKITSGLAPCLSCCRRFCFAALRWPWGIARGCCLIGTPLSQASWYLPCLLITCWFVKQLACALVVAGLMSYRRLVVLKVSWSTRCSRAHTSLHGRGSSGRRLAVSGRQCRCAQWRESWADMLGAAMCECRCHVLSGLCGLTAACVLCLL